MVTHNITPLMFIQRSVLHGIRLRKGKGCIAWKVGQKVQKGYRQHAKEYSNLGGAFACTYFMTSHGYHIYHIYIPSRRGPSFDFPIGKVGPDAKWRKTLSRKRNITSSSNLRNSAQVTKLSRICPARLRCGISLLSQAQKATTDLHRDYRRPRCISDKHVMLFWFRYKTLSAKAKRTIH
jgi:hypothetical protein